MNTDIKAVNFTMKEDARDYLSKKLERVHNAENMIVDFLITLTKEANDFNAEATVNFRWGVQAHVKATDPMLTTSIDKMMDAVKLKITKEKEKVKEKR